MEHSNRLVMVGLIKVNKSNRGQTTVPNPPSQFRTEFGAIPSFIASHTDSMLWTHDPV